MRFLVYFSCFLTISKILVAAPDSDFDFKGESGKTIKNSNDQQQFSTIDYSAIFTILNTRNFLDTLEKPFTIFIPTNTALHQFSHLTLKELSLPENADTLSRLVDNHVVNRKILRQDFEKFNNKEIKNLSGRNLTLKSEGNILSVDGARILKVQPAGDDGVLYVIDRVLWP